MSLQRKIEAEIKVWEDKIAARQLLVDRMKLKIQHLKQLLEMAQKVEEQ